MDDNEIRNEIIQALYREHRKIPDAGILDMNILANDFGVDSHTMEFNVSLLNAAGFTKFAAMGGMIELTDKGILYADGPSPFNPPDNYNQQKIEVSGGTIGQIVQGHDVTINTSEFFDHLLHRIDEHPDLAPAKKKNWKQAIKGFMNSPLFLEIFRWALGASK